MIKKISKRIISILCMIVMLLPMSTEVIAKITQTAKGTQQAFGNTFLHKSNKLNGEEGIEFGYRIDTKNYYRLNSNGNDYETAILCLDKSLRVPEYTSGSNSSNLYTSLGEANLSNLRSVKSDIDSTDAAKIQWLIRNAILPEDSEETKNLKLAKIFNDLLEQTSQDTNVLTLNDIKNVLTEDDLVFALQCVVWQITNNIDIGTLQGTTDPTGNEWDSLEGNDMWGYKGKKGTYIRTIINYYNNQLAGSLEEDTSTKTNPSFTDKAVSTTVEGAYSFVGPFYINTATNYYSVDVEFEDISGNKLNGVSYFLLDTTSTKNVTKLPQTKEGLEGKNFYVAVRTNTTARKIKITLTTQAQMTSAEGTVWSNGTTSEQPILTISRTEEAGKKIIIEKDFDINIEFQYDASLRKYISGLKRKTAMGSWRIYTLDTLGAEAREPSAPVVSTGTTIFNQYEYLHRKEPLEVKVGDRIVYTIVVTNECDEEIIVQNITDYLPPEGLEYVAEEAVNTNNNWTYNQESRTVVTDYTSNIILNPGSQTQVQIICEVTEDAAAKVITNIAEITQLSDADGKMVTDIDSTPNQVKLPDNNEGWENYKGNDTNEFGNKEDLSDPNYYYNGQEDDDDFEKIKVPGIKDVALRKSIIQVNDSEKSRKRDPDTTPLKDSDDSTTTSNFTDIKDPVEVKVGDIVTYSIRVYNEGEEDMYVGAIEDYLPEGLGYLPEHVLNIRNQWYVESSTNTKKLSDIPNAISNITQADFSEDVSDYKNANVVVGKATIKTTKLKNEIITAYDKTNDILYGKEIQVVCVVLNTVEANTIIKNIAAITEYRDNAGTPVTPDIDSDTTTKINPDTYPSDSNIQDDDDFEKLILTVAEGKYNIKIVKADKDDNSKKLSGATFNITMPTGAISSVTTDNNGTTTTSDIKINQIGTDTIKIEETKAPDGYNKLIDNLEIQVTKEIQNGIYVATNATLKTVNENATVTMEGTTIVITVKNEKATGKYNLQIIKEDKSDSNKKLSGAVFDVTMPNGTKNSVTTDNNGQIKTSDINITTAGTDTIKIEETQAPDGYNKLINALEISVTKELKDGSYVPTKATLSATNEKAAVTISGTTIIVTIKNEKITGNYNLQIIKEDKLDSNKKLDGAVFKVTMSSGAESSLTTDNNGQVKTSNVEMTEVGTDTIKIEETQAPEGYNKLINNIEIQITKEMQNGKYVATNATLKTANENVAVTLNGTTIIATIKNEKITGKYNIQIVKEDKSDSSKKLSGAEFNITMPDGSKKLETTDNNGQIKTEDIDITGAGTDTIKIEETKAPDKYKKLIDSLEIQITKKENNGVYEIKDAVFKNSSENAKIEIKGITVVITVLNEKEKYDLALKKFITQIEEKEVANRLQEVDTTPLKNGKTDANYTMDKSVLEVSTGDIVTYTIRIFNEGEIDGYAQQVKDNIPEGLEFIEDSETNKKYRWKEENGKVITDYLSKEVNQDKIIKAFNKETGEISYQDLKIEFKVIAKESKVITNIAEIKNDDGEDIDSTPDDYIPEEDDQDYDNIIPAVYDLALKKYITGVSTTNGSKKTIPTNQKRELKVTDVTELINRENLEKADAEYILNKTPVEVSKGDYVTYTIRVFNEGTTDAIVKEILDTIPEGLEFVGYTEENGTYKSGSNINYKYGWKMYDVNGNETKDSNKAQSIRTAYLNQTIISAFNANKQNEANKGLSYADVQVEFKVVTSEHKVLKNIAEITDDDGNDDDSTPDNNIPAEDDQDYDVVIPLEFDLALRKFITQIDKTEVKDRIPKVEISNNKITYNHTKEPIVVVREQIVTYTIRVYNEGTQDGYATEIKDDLPEGITFLPENETNIKYKWKMYDINGRETKNVAEAVTIKTDYLSKEESEKRGEDNLLEAFKNNAEISENNPDYREVKVAFEVTLDNVTEGNRIIINTAEISKDEDKDGNEVEDIDSIPDNDKEDEDDIDKEYIEMRYFDLSLLKYVSKVIVTEDGVIKETETGYDGTENPEPVVKVELNKKKLDKTEVKYVYSIKITNEGEIEGYATEITDRIPDGLEFYEEDNTEYNWKTEEDGKVTTDYLKDTLLQPGESAIIQIVLRWRKDENNLGQKVNVAEISDDDNPYDIPDIDSVPDNNKDGEDDQDEAIVVLSLVTGSARVYIVLTITIMVILASGFYLINKYVIQR